MFNLQGKTALITGATRGIGNRIAHALHQAGAQVILSATNQSKLDEAAKAFGNNSNSQGAYAIAADLSDSAAIDQLTEKAEAIAAIDILVNNAGLTRDQLAMRMSGEDWDTVMKVDLAAPFQISKNLLRGMMKRRWGRIVNISSVVGATGNPGQANYAAAKAGIIGMSKSIAREVASRGITVNCIAPGFIESDMTADLAESTHEALKAQIPMGRMGSGDDIAAAAVFLASEEAAYITGETLHVNGGMLMA